MNKIINDVHYHVWSDALHLRQLARQTPDKWDRSTYVRAAVVMAWTAFETALADVLNAQRIGGKFRENVDAAVYASGLAPLDWGKGIWQSVAHLNACRVDYVHRTAAGTDLFPEVSVVDGALQTIRNALTDLYHNAGKAPPIWTSDDSDRGWTGSGKGGCYAYGIAIHGRVDQDALDTLRVAFVDKRGEHIHAYHPPGADPNVLAAELLKNLREPVSTIRVYRGDSVELEWILRMRGAP
jgi:hypothetical protein